MSDAPAPGRVKVKVTESIEMDAKSAEEVARVTGWPIERYPIELLRAEGMPVRWCRWLLHRRLEILAARAAMIHGAREVRRSVAKGPFA